MVTPCIREVNYTWCKGCYNIWIYITASVIITATPWPAAMSSHYINVFIHLRKCLCIIHPYCLQTVQWQLSHCNCDSHFQTLNSWIYTWCCWIVETDIWCVTLLWILSSVLANIWLGHWALWWDPPHAIYKDRCFHLVVTGCHFQLSTNPSSMVEWLRQNKKSKFTLSGFKCHDCVSDWLSQQSVLKLKPGQVLVSHSEHKPHTAESWKLLMQLWK